MSKTVFKKGDKVFCILNGHGRVVDIWDEDGADPVRIQFDKDEDGDDCGYTIPVRIQFDKDEDGDDCGYTIDGRYYEHITPTLSFTEYTLSGFSQERPLELPEVGEEIMVSLDKNIWVLGKFTNYFSQLEYGIEVMFEDGEIDNYKYFKRLR